MKDLKLNMYISVLVLLSFIVAVIFIGSKSTKCANLAHDEWTEKDDEQAHKLAYPKPTKREENYFTENGLVRDKKRGKSHVAKFCQRCVLIVKDKLEEPEEKQQLSATCTVTTVNEELCGISSPAQEAGTFSNLEPIQTNTEAGTDDKSTTRSTLTSDQGTCSSVIDGLNLEQVTTPISTPSQESVLDSTPQNCNSFFEPGIITVPRVHLQTTTSIRHPLLYSGLYCSKYQNQPTLHPPSPPPGWNSRTENDHTIYYQLDFVPENDPIISKTLTINSNGTHVVRLYGRTVTGNMFELPALNNVAILDLLLKLSSLRLCKGHTDPKYRLVATSWDQRKHHKHVHYQRIHTKGSVSSMSIRSDKCVGYVKGSGLLCQHCSEFGNTLRPTYLRLKAYQGRQNERTDTGSKAPISSLNLVEAQNRAKKAAKEKRNLRQQIRRLQEKIRKSIKADGELLNKEQSEEFLETMQEHNKTIMDTYPPDSFESLFWKEQMKASMAKSASGHRWHPMIIKWALNIRMASGKAYRSLRGSGVLKLPHESTLREYLHWTPPKSKFTVAAVKQLCAEIDKDGLKPHQKNVALIHDEMKIKSDLVYRKGSGELVGFTDLDSTANILRHYEAAISKDTAPEKSLAKYVFVIMIRGLFVKITYPFAQFPTTNTKSDEIFSLTWRAIEILHMAGLNVVVITCDGAATNRRFFDLHGGACPNQTKPIHRTPNPYNPGKEVFLISDPPHLIKCVRNAWASSYAHELTRTLWNNGTISWKSIKDLYRQRVEMRGLYTSKLTLEHVELTTYSKMKVRLAAQVLSTTVENALPETERVTKEFVRTFDKFFDVLNVRSYKKEALRKKKKNLREYDDPDDPRLQWLVGDFLKYLQDWENAVMARQNYTKKQKNKMLLPQETLTSLKRTALGASAAVKSLLREVEGVDYVLTERFNQDPLESLFGNFRQMNGGADTPNPQQINEMMNAARLRSTSMLKNFRGNTQQVQDYQEVNNTAIPKKKKKRYSEEK